MWVSAPWTQCSKGEIIKDLRPSLRGWYEYFKHSNRWAMLEVDAYFRRRLRSIIAKYKRKKGTHRIIDNRKYTKKYFAELGFFSLEEAWLLESQSLRSKHWPESRMREIRTCGSEGGEAPQGAFPTLIHVLSFARERVKSCFYAAFSSSSLYKLGLIILY